MRLNNVDALNKTQNSKDQSEILNLKSEIPKAYHSLYGVPSVEVSVEALCTSVMPDCPSIEYGSSPVVMAQSFCDVKGSTGTSRIYPSVTNSSSDCGRRPLSAAN